MSYAISKTNQKLIAQSEALKKIHEHNRDFLSLKITIPLGNKALKNVHTNQWLFTDLPREFDLANWTVIADALNANTNRYEGYVQNRWYIEGVDVNVDVKGKAEMTLTLNAFASSYQSYTEASREMQNAYSDAVKRLNQNNNNSTSASKKKTNAVTTQSVLNKTNIKKYKIPKAVYSKAEQICKGKRTDYDKAYAIYKWMDAHIGSEFYYDHKYSEAQVLSRGKGNCVDNSRLYRAFCLSVGLKCNFVKNTCTCCANGKQVNHQYNKVYINGKGKIVDCGRTNASWGSNWGGHANCGRETTVSW